MVNREAQNGISPVTMEESEINVVYLPLSWNIQTFCRILGILAKADAAYPDTFLVRHRTVTLP